MQRQNTGLFVLALCIIATLAVAAPAGAAVTGAKTTVFHASSLSPYSGAGSFTGVSGTSSAISSFTPVDIRGGSKYSGYNSLPSSTTSLGSALGSYTPAYPSFTPPGFLVPCYCTSG